MTDTKLSRHIVDAVRKLFSRQQSGLATAGARGDIRELRTAPKRSEPAAGPNEVNVSKLELIGLAQVRSSLGGHWPALAEHTRSVAESVIKRHIVPGDVYERCGDDGFLVLFAQLAPADAHFKARILSKEIEKSLIAAGLAHVATCSAEMTKVNVGADITEPCAADSDAKADTGHHVAWDDGNALHAGGVPSHMHSPVPPDRQRINSNGERDTPFGPQTRSGTTPEAGGHDRSNDGRARKQETSRGSAPSKTSDVRWFYRPVWDYRHSALILFALKSELPDEFELGEQGNRAGPAETEFMADIDTAAVNRAAVDLLALSKSSRRLPLLLKAHYQSLKNPRLCAYLRGAIENVPQQFHSFLFLEIVGLPEGETAADLSSFIGAMKVIGVRMAVRVNPLWPEPPRIENCGADFVSMILPSAHSEVVQMKTMEIMAERALKAKLDCAVWDITTRSMVIAAASAGIRYLSGSAIAPDIQSLSHASRYSLANLYPRC